MCVYFIVFRVASKRMHTPETDREQMAYNRKWMQEKTRKKKERLEKKLQKCAAMHFGKPVAVVYAKTDAKIAANDGEVSETVYEALETQIPKELLMNDKDRVWYQCPRCNGDLTHLRTMYCPYCGQKLEW